MILYVGASLYHILCFSVHKLLYHPSDDAVLVIGDNIFSKSGMEELKEDLTESKIFQRIEILKFIEGSYQNPVKLKEESQPEQVKQYIDYNTEWVKNWLSRKKLDVKEITEFNSAIDHRHLGLYILAEHIPYQYFEDGNGLLSREQVQLEFHKKAQYASYAVTKYLHALGQSECVTKRYANADAQVEGFTDEKMEDFNVIRLFSTLKEEDQKRMLQMFHTKPLDFKEGEKPVLYLTRYVKYLQNPTMENHHFISAMILDLFAEDSPVVIKPHPRDFSGRYRDLFPDAIVLEKQFPSELLPIIQEGTYKKIITTGSTAIDALADYTDEIIKLDVDFENKIEHIYRYIGVVLAVRELFPNLQPEDIRAVGCVREFLNPLCRQFWGFIIPEEMDAEKEYRIILADDMAEHIPKSECICYLNTKQDYRFVDFHSNGFEDMQYVNVSAKKESHQSYGMKKEEALFFYTENNSLKQKIGELYLKHVFPRTGIILFIGNFSWEKKEYMKMLSEIIYLKYQRERMTNGETEEEALFLVPRIKKHVTKDDLKSIKYLLAAVRQQGRNDYENNRICTNETE